MAKKTPTFKRYDQQQLMILPPSLEELIPKGHPVRIVNDVINRIDLESLFKAYHITGSSSYHPQMLLKVLIYGYVTNIYSSRKLEGACRESIYFMWLSSMSFPDHNTLNRFRSVRLKHALRSVFEDVVQLLAEEGLLSLEEVYTDGTKIEANANRYTFVWKKAIITSKERMKRQLEEIWQYAQNLAQKEDTLPPTPDFTQIDSEKVKETVDKLNETLRDRKDIDKKVRAKLGYITKNFPEKIVRYEQQEAILGERNSYSKTDTDATFMRMKDDHMLNGQLKPGYNVQISTSNQFIVNFTLHSNPTDTTTLKGHLEQYEQSFGRKPKTLTADAGYGSAENYTFLEQNGVIPYVKYGTFNKELEEKDKDKNPFHPQNLYYNAEKDVYTCPMGQEMIFIGLENRHSENGFVHRLRKYQAKNCFNCPLHSQCHKSKENRTIRINTNLEKQKQRVKELLVSEDGIRHRKRRCYEVESVFGNIKQNHGFRRFMLRGKEKVEIEWGLLAIAQNLRKKAA